MQESILQVAQLRKALPYGAITKIHKRLTVAGHDISYTSVQAVIDGVYRNDTVIEFAIAFLEEYNQEQAKKNSALNERIKQATEKAS